MSHTLFAVLIGILTGCITSLIGSSGVMIIVPILSMFFSVSVHTAIGVSLFVDVIASITVSYSYYKNGNIDLISGIWIALGALAGSQLGTLFASNMSESNLGSSFGIVTLLTGLFMLFKKEKESKFAKFINFKYGWQRKTFALLTGLFIGIISGIYGAGGGVMFLLALIVIMSLPLHKAIGTSTFIMALTALSGTIGYGIRGHIDIILGVTLGIGSIIGSYLGSMYANKVNETTLKKITGSIFIAIGALMSIIPLFIAK